jgi:hypothetical protein
MSSVNESFRLHAGGVTLVSPEFPGPELPPLPGSLALPAEPELPLGVDFAPPEPWSFRFESLLPTEMPPLHAERTSAIVATLVRVSRRFVLEFMT